MNLTKEKIIEEISEKPIYDISNESATAAAKDINFTKCRKYSPIHYKTRYAIIKKKVETFDNDSDKIAYLNCLQTIYKSLSNYDFIDISLIFISGGCLGVSVFENNVLYKIISLIIFIALVSIKSYITSTRKWDFYNSIFEHIKDEIK